MRMRRVWPLAQRIHYPDIHLGEMIAHLLGKCMKISRISDSSVFVLEAKAGAVDIAMGLYDGLHADVADHHVGRQNMVVDRRRIAFAAEENIAEPLLQLGDRLGEAVAGHRRPADMEDLPGVVDSVAMIGMVM